MLKLTGHNHRKHYMVKTVNHNGLDKAITWSSTTVVFILLVNLTKLYQFIGDWLRSIAVMIWDKAILKFYRNFRIFITDELRLCYLFNAEALCSYSQQPINTRMSSINLILTPYIRNNLFFLWQNDTTVFFLYYKSILLLLSRSLH